MFTVIGATWNGHMAKLELHKHNFKDIKLIEIVSDNKQWNRDLIGGWTALLVRVCQCSAEQAFEFGTRDKMQALLKDLKK